MARGRKPQIPTGLDYGERAQLERIPTPDSGGQPSASSGQAPAPMARPVVPPQFSDMFGPTERPNEPVTAGIPFGPGPGPNRPMIPEDPDEIIRVMAELTGHPAILDLLPEAF